MCAAHTKWLTWGSCSMQSMPLRVIHLKLLYMLLILMSQVLWITANSGGFWSWCKTALIPCHLVASQLGAESSCSCIQCLDVTRSQPFMAKERKQLGSFGVHSMIIWSMSSRGYQNIQGMYHLKLQAMYHQKTWTKDVLVCCTNVHLPWVKYLKPERGCSFLGIVRLRTFLEPRVHLFSMWSGLYTKLATYGVNVCRVIPLYLLQPHGVGREQTTHHGDPVGQHCQKTQKRVQELLRCGCKKACSKRCKCVKANLKCTQLCFCAGRCSR